MEFILEDGVYKNRWKNFETELSFNDSLLMIQFSVLRKGLFVPCFDLSQFECKYSCKKNKGNRCPYSQNIEEIERSEIKYVRCNEDIKSIEGKIKGFLCSVCSDEGYISLVEGEWIYKKSGKQIYV